MGYDPGPWWWRLRCRLADRLWAMGACVEPNDRGTTHYVEGKGLHERIVILQTRRRVP